MPGCPQGGQHKPLSFFFILKVGSNYVGTSADGKSEHTDGQVWGSLSWLRRLAIDVSIVTTTAVSHSGAGACGESFLNPNAGTRAAEETKTKKCKLPERPALRATKLDSYSLSRIVRFLSLSGHRIHRRDSCFVCTSGLIWGSSVGFIFRMHL